MLKQVTDEDFLRCERRLRKINENENFANNVFEIEKGYFSLLQ